MREHIKDIVKDTIGMNAHKIGGTHDHSCHLEFWADYISNALSPIKSSYQGYTWEAVSDVVMVCSEVLIEQNKSV